uniref:DNA-directed RNA polymerase subunit beta n=1 Tax=Pherosphaera fitzgeraldii TaxID=56896 RepID=A0A3T0ZDQ6_9CONI|nr:RNA polymerase beta subunit [Pherosphaera fitzgeraldii]BBF91004.1 RNA polymerase beta chain [Pherosphaera fitzgeraldii]
MRLDENKGTFTIPEFGKIQFEGFCRFIDQGLIEELRKFPKIESPNKKIEFLLSGNRYELEKPTIKERDAVYKSLTYCSELRVPAKLIHRTSRRRICESDVILGKIPLMNSKGFFVVNGNYRVVVNQILRSPGIYYTSKEKNNEIIYSATIISDWGGRSRLEIDKTERIWAYVKKKKKISVLLLLLAMGLDLEDITYNAPRLNRWMHCGGPELKTQSKGAMSREEAILEFYKQLYLSDDEVEDSDDEVEDSDDEVETNNDLIFSESLCKKLQERFFQQKCELGKIGRRNLNKKLNLNIPETEIFLLPQDVLAAVDHLIKVRSGGVALDDIDHLQNKRIRSVADLLQIHFELALVFVEEEVKDTMMMMESSIRLNPNDLVTPVTLTKIFQDFFGLHPLSQFLDQTNPLAEIVHSRKLSYLGPEGLTPRTATFRIRDIHPSYYGRLCPIATSEGMNAGLVTALSIYATLGPYDSLQTPFYKISERSKEEHMVSLSPGEDEYYRIATGDYLALDHGVPEEQFTPAQYQQEFLVLAWEQIDLRTIFPFQYFSVGVCLVPFLEHNDANRALMGSNMQRQAIASVQPEKCIVGTGLEGQAALDSGSVAIATQKGSIKYIDAVNITSYGYRNTRKKHTRKKIERTELALYQRSNSNTCIHQKPRIRQGQCVKKGQILADGAATVGGELSLGKNILVAYMPWEGYNFEDAVLISERLVYENIYTSFHIVRYKIGIYIMNDESSEIITRKIPHLNAHLLRHLDKKGLVKLGSWVETGDVLVGKLTPQTAEESLSLYTPEERLLHAILGIELSNARENCLKVPIGVRGRVIDVRWIRKEDIYDMDYTKEIHVYILQKRKIKVGDKVAGRHGNKGIISIVLPRQDMPYLQNGTPVDMVLNPLGVPSRMNVGQIFECLLGLAGKLMNKHYRISPFDERYEPEASRKLVYSELYKASELTANPWVFEPDHPGKHRLIDGRTGAIFEQPVTIGMAYMMKLSHQVDDKIHARSSGPYARVTQQPLKGKSRRGGQRVGEMEVWALEGFGVAYILHEILTLKSDHIDGRKKILGAILAGEPIPKPDTTPESFRLLSRELRSLALELTHAMISEKDFQIDRKEI